MDTSYQILVLARRISGLGGTHMLQKVKFLIDSCHKKKKQHIHISKFIPVQVFCANLFRISLVTDQPDLSSGK